MTSLFQMAPPWELGGSSGEQSSQQLPIGASSQLARKASCPSVRVQSSTVGVRVLACLFVSGQAAQMAAALELVLGKPPAMVHVDVAGKLTEAGLAKHFPLPLWPPTAAVRNCNRCQSLIMSSCGVVFAQVRELATKIKSLKKTGEPNPYVFCELKK